MARRPLPLPARLHRLRWIAGDDVVATFSAAGDTYGWPAATLTDNGAVYTSRFTGGRNAFESLLAYLGIRQKNRHRASADAGPDRALPPDAQALARAAARSADPGPSCRASSMPSGSSTTSSRATGPSDGSRQARPTGRRPGCTRPDAVPRATSGFATTWSIAVAGSACAGPAARITWGSEPPTPAGASSPSATSPRSRSSPSTRARSSPHAASSPRRPTGATNEGAPADGRGPGRPSDATAGPSMVTTSRLRCRTCRHS